MANGLQLVSTAQTAPRGGSAAVALERLETVDPSSESWESELSGITLGFVDALLQADVEALQEAADPLRDALARLFDDGPHAREVRGWLLALLSVTRWGIQRLPATAELELPRNTQAWAFLQELRLDWPRSSSELRTRLGTGDSQISRVGRDLLARGLVTQRRLGREAQWELTPRGHQLLRTADTSPAPWEGRAAGQAAARGSAGAPTRSGEAASRRAGSRVAKSSAPRRADHAVRHVFPDDGHGWRVAKRRDGKAIARSESQAVAIGRAKEIVGRQGGGVVRVHARSGTEREIRVLPR